MALSDRPTTSAADSSTTASNEGALGISTAIPSSHWPAVVEHVERAAQGLYWIIVDDDWRILAASQTFQAEVLLEKRGSPETFLDCLYRPAAMALERRRAEDGLEGEPIELLHPVRTGRRSVSYLIRRIGDSWMLFGRDYSSEQELVTQMAALVEDLEQEMMRERQLADRLRSLLAADHLTGLSTRRRVEEVVSARWESFVASGTPFGVVAIDVDHFKRVNDRFGHDVGDDVLRAVARALETSVRASDTAGRFGGEEFVVVTSATDLETTTRVAERIRRRVQVARMPGAVGTITVSLGVACADSCEVESAEELLKRADEALYAAKAAGRNRVEVAPSRGDVE